MSTSMLGSFRPLLILFRSWTHQHQRCSCSVTTKHRQSVRAGKQSSLPPHPAPQTARLYRTDRGWRVGTRAGWCMSMCSSGVQELRGHAQKVKARHGNTLSAVNYPLWRLAEETPHQGPPPLAMQIVPLRATTAPIRSAKNIKLQKPHVYGRMSRRMIRTAATGRAMGGLSSMMLVGCDIGQALRCGLLGEGWGACTVPSVVRRLDRIVFSADWRWALSPSRLNVPSASSSTGAGLGSDLLPSLVLSFSLRCSSVSTTVVRARSGPLLHFLPSRLGGEGFPSTLAIPYR